MQSSFFVPINARTFKGCRSRETDTSEPVAAFVRGRKNMQHFFPLFLVFVFERQGIDIDAVISVKYYGYRR
jgi:hypothetical protein